MSIKGQVVKWIERADLILDHPHHWLCTLVNGPLYDWWDDADLVFDRDRGIDRRSSEQRAEDQRAEDDARAWRRDQGLES